MEYGYVRVSTKNQSLQRQRENILRACPTVKFYEEKVTGTKLELRKEFKKLIGLVKKGDTIYFDSVSRMSRNAAEGFKIYQDLFNKGVNLIFLKEGYINTSVYKKALESNLALTGTTVDILLEGVEKYLMALAEEQIKIAFEQSEKEVRDLQVRTSEGMRVAKANGKQIGQKKGAKLITKKSLEMKENIRKLSKDFQGNLKDKEILNMLNISRNTFYKYKKEMLEEENK